MAQLLLESSVDGGSDFVSSSGCGPVLLRSGTSYRNDVTTRWARGSRSASNFDVTRHCIIALGQMGAVGWSYRILEELGVQGWSFDKLHSGSTRRVSFVNLFIARSILCYGAGFLRTIRSDCICSVD